MRWKLMSLFVSLMTVTSAKYHNKENIVAVVGSRHHEDYKNELAEAGHENSSYSAYDKEKHIFKIVSLTSEDSDNNGISVVLPDITAPRPTSSQETRETSESVAPEQSQYTTEPNETSEISKETSDNQSHGDEPPQIQSSEETTETPENLETGSTSEPEKTETPESVEVTSGENQTDEGSEVHPPPVVRSSEEIGAGGEDSAQEEINMKHEEIQTTHGPVRGYRWSSNAEIIAYYDIPYGNFSEPFATPVTAQSWLSVHDIPEHTKVCPQLVENKYIGDMNCLTLSIFTPKNAKNSSVLFHVYDGYTNHTSADPLIYGPDYLVPKGIILVLPNYRVGPMGFLCLQNETALGNAGLKDLALALEWVKDNIHLFGGNPSNIVVSGDGAAGAYAGYLGICSRSKYYVDKVISESGSALSHWALDRDPVGTAYTLAEKIRIDHSDGIIYNNTFAEASLETILKAAKGMQFKPCIEHDKEPLIHETPWKILQGKKINTTFMIGSASYAGTHEATDTTADFVAQINDHFGLLLPEDLIFSNDATKQEYALKLREQYFGEDNITVNDIEEFSLWYTDASYLGPGIRLARRLVSAGATVYIYEFAFVGSLNRELEALHRPVAGAVRGDLMGYLFHKNETSVELDSPEQLMIELMTKLWVSFINKGKPEATDVEWHDLKLAQDEEEEWLVISSEPKIKRGIHVDRLRLWTNLYEQHFIDNSVAKLGPHYLTVTVICLIANKLNYGNQ